MNKVSPIYTAENVNFAYQLRWAMSLFSMGDRPPESTLAPMAESLETDGIRVLSYRYANPTMVQLTISVKPDMSPSTIAQRVKGRLWYAWKDHKLVTIDKHYALRSYGTQEREIIEQYVAGQALHHPMATEKATSLFEELTYIAPEIDLSQAIQVGDSLLWYNLHIVLAHVERWRTVNRSVLEAVREMILRVAIKYNWRLSRCGIVADHVHLAIGVNAQDSAQEVVLKFMNNLAFVHGMKPIYSFGAFVSTFGEYDQRVIR